MFSKIKRSISERKNKAGNDAKKTVSKKAEVLKQEASSEFNKLLVNSKDKVNSNVSEKMENILPMKTSKSAFSPMKEVSYNTGSDIENQKGKVGEVLSGEATKLSKTITGGLENQKGKVGEVLSGEATKLSDSLENQKGKVGEVLSGEIEDTKEEEHWYDTMKKRIYQPAPVEEDDSLIESIVNSCMVDLSMKLVKELPDQEVRTNKMCIIITEHEKVLSKKLTKT